jgi:YVTN family beta-propeller protein
VRLRYPMFCLLLTANCLLSAGLTAASEYLGPSAVLASKDQKSLFVLETDAKRIAVVGLDGQAIGSIPMPAEPTGMALSGDGTKLYVTCAAPKSTVCIVDTASRAVVGTIPAGHTASGPALSPDGTRLYVCNRFNNNVSVFDTATKQEIARVPAVREPIAAAATPDGKTVYVINLVPLDRADSYDVAAKVTVIDTASNRSAMIRLPNGSSSVHGLCISPDGRYVYVAHILSRYQMPTTQLERGWMNTNALTIIDAAKKQSINTVLLDDVDLGAANPWGVATTADGRTICVTHAGTHELSVIDAPGLIEKLAKVAAPAGLQKKPDPGNAYTPPALTAGDVPNDLSFLVGLRRRIKLDGNGPRGLAVIGTTAYVAEYFSDAVAAVDLREQVYHPVQRVAIGPVAKLTPERRGEMLFHDAEICFQHWQSCSSCHPDARVDGLNWDLMNDGLGNPKNSRSMLLTHQGGPAMSLGVRDSAKTAVRSGITHILFAVRPEEEAAAIDEYLKALRPVASPYLVEGQLTPAAEHGKQIFFNPKVGCAECHPEPLYSDKKSHDVGSAGRYDKHTDKFNTPRLVECWRTAPYMHDGHYLTIKELLNEGQHGFKGRDTKKLSEKDLDDLVEFVLSL